MPTDPETPVNHATLHLDGVTNPAPGGVDDASPHASSAALAQQVVTRKLDLACGQSPRAGFEGVDIWPGAQHIVNLMHYPWPFDDGSVAELHCSHYIEHIPMEFVLINPEEGPPGTCYHGVDPGLHARAKDALFAFFDECWRVLVPDGWLHVIVPAHRSDRAFQDPTHRRFITAQTFAYMSEQERRNMRIDHYNVDCNFIGSCDPIVDASLALRNPETAQWKMQREWNVVLDWTARLQKKPRLQPLVRP